MKQSTYLTGEAHAMRRFVLFATVFVFIAIAGTMLPRSRAHAGVSAGQSSLENWHREDCRGDEGNTHNHFGWGSQSRVCELRRTTFALSGKHLGVNSENGGIEMVGEDRNDVAVEARVQAWAGSEEDAREILRQVQIDTSGDQIRDHGPQLSHFGRSGYGVSYRLHVPRRLAADLHSMNGGIEIAHLEGEIRFDTTNGGVELNDLAGSVHGQTVNGGLEIALTGDRWRGEGLHAETTNGGVEMSVPQHYNAHLEAGTVNGGISVDFPVTLQGNIKNRLSTDIGSGGQVIHAETTNGGVSISRSL
jgi:hypothetical protein